MPQHVWQKSSFSGDQANCIELARAPGAAVHIRESDDPDVILTAPPTALAALAAAVRGGGITPLRTC